MRRLIFNFPMAPFGIGVVVGVAAFELAREDDCSANAYSSRLITSGAESVRAADFFKKSRRLDLAFIYRLAQFRGAACVRFYIK